MLGKGASFGEYALLSNSRRAGTVKCLKDCHFAVLGKYEYQKTFGKLQEEKMDQKIDLLKRVPCLNDWARTTVS